MRHGRRVLGAMEEVAAEGAGSHKYGIPLQNTR